MPDLTVPPPRPPGMSPVLSRNISTLEERRKREQGEAAWQDRAADAITRFIGSMPFVYLHAAIFGAWILVNAGWLPVVPRFDESFVILGTAASVEAIFLSTFVLISQNRMSAQASRRADLDLQISLLAEHEITRLIALTASIAERLGVEEAHDPALKELVRDVAPEAVLDELSDEGGDQDGSPAGRRAR